MTVPQKFVAGFLVLIACVGVQAQLGMPSTHAPKPAANRQDIPYIRCQVCSAMIKQALAIAKQLKADATPANPFKEGDLMDQLETMCSLDNDAGDWIRRFDLQEDGDKLNLVDMNNAGKCGVECATIAKACEQISDKLDLSDMSEMLYKGTTRSALTQWSCYDESGVCKSKATPLPKDRSPGPAFEEEDPTSLQHQSMLRKMKAAGLKGTMYDRESIQNNLDGFMKDGSGDDDDDDDSSASNLKAKLSGGEL